MLNYNIKRNNINIEELFLQDEKFYKHLYQIPSNMERLVVLDTEITKLTKDEYVMEIAGSEIENGMVTGSQIKGYIHPKFIVKENVQTSGITKQYYDNNYKGFCASDKENLLYLIKWINNSIIFSHNAPAEIKAINRELNFYGIKEIPKEKFRCSMRIFAEIINKVDPLYNLKNISLEKCCEYFGLETSGKKYHEGLYDSILVGKLMLKLYQKIDDNPVILKDFDYLNQKSLETHYYAYKRHKNENKKK